MAINPTLAARRKKTAKDTDAIHEKASLVSKSSMHPGKNASTHGHAVLEVTRIAPMRISAKTGESP